VTEVRIEYKPGVASKVSVPGVLDAVGRAGLPAGDSFSEEEYGRDWKAARRNEAAKVSHNKRCGRMEP